MNILHFSNLHRFWYLLGFLTSLWWCSFVLRLWSSWSSSSVSFSLFGLLYPSSVVGGIFGDQIWLIRDEPCTYRISYIVKISINCQISRCHICCPQQTVTYLMHQTGNVTNYHSDNNLYFSNFFSLTYDKFLRASHTCERLCRDVVGWFVTFVNCGKSVSRRPIDAIEILP